MVMADDAMDHLLDRQPDELVRYFFPESGKPMPSGIAATDWAKHIFALRSVVAEICCVSNGTTLFSVLKQFESEQGRDRGAMSLGGKAKPLESKVIVSEHMSDAPKLPQKGKMEAVAAPKQKVAAAKQKQAATGLGSTVSDELERLCLAHEESQSQSTEEKTAGDELFELLQATASPTKGNGNKQAAKSTKPEGRSRSGSKNNLGSKNSSPELKGSKGSASGGKPGGKSPATGGKPHKTPELKTKSPASVGKPPETTESTIGLLLAMLKSHGGRMAASQCCSSLYEAHPSCKAVVKAAGGLRALCAKHNGLMFQNGSGGDEICVVVSRKLGTEAAVAPKQKVAAAKPKQGGFTKIATALLRPAAVHSIDNRA